MFQSVKKMNENEIRPRNLLDKQRELMLQDIEYLLSFQDQFIEVPCPACKGDNFKKIFEKFSMTYNTCDNCQTMFISPRPTPKILGDFYANSANYDYWATHIFPTSEKVRTEKIFRPRAERVRQLCEKYESASHTMIEIGAGYGTFGYEVQKLGFVNRYIAVEPSNSLAEKCKSRGLEVINKPIEQANFESESIDIICSFEVVEHLFNPLDILETCYRILKPGGLIIVTNPNGKGFDVVTAPQISTTVDVEHLNYFNPDSMEILLGNAGFEVIEVMTPGLLDTDIVRNMFLNGDLKQSDNPFLYQILIDKWDEAGSSFQEFLVNNKLSSHMWTIARKKN